MQKKYLHNKKLLNITIKGGRYGKNIISRFFFYFYFFYITIHDFITILCHVGFTILQVVWALQPN